MFKRFMACASIIAFIASTPVAMADNVDMPAAERAANAKEYAKRKAQGLPVDEPRGRGSAKKTQKGKKQQPEQQAAQSASQRCQEAVNNAQKMAVGTSVLSAVVGFVPFGGAASGIAGAAAGVGASAVGEIARQKSAAAMQENC